MAPVRTALIFAYVSSFLVIFDVIHLEILQRTCIFLIERRNLKNQTADRLNLDWFES